MSTAEPTPAAAVLTPEERMVEEGEEEMILDAPSDNNVLDDDQEGLIPEEEPSLSSQEEDPAGPYRLFKPIKTITAGVVSITVSFLMIVMVFLVPFLCEKDGPMPPRYHCALDSFSVLIYCHSFLWVVHLVIDPYLKKKHKISRMAGYLTFYLATKNTRRAPFYLVSIGNFTLLLAMTALNDYCIGADNCPDSYMKLDWLRGLITVECMGLMSMFSYYIRCVKQFNKAQQRPDCMRESYMRRLRVNLSLCFEQSRPPVIHMDDPAAYVPDEEIAIQEETAFQRYLSDVTEWDSDRRELLCEMVRFLIQQTNRKNQKLFALALELHRVEEAYTELKTAIVRRRGNVPVQQDDSILPSSEHEASVQMDDDMDL